MSIPTPQYRLQAIRAHDVYEPAEDTFLLIDAIEKDIKEIRSRNPQLVLEIGCGSGVVSTFVNQALGGNVTSMATDLNPHALDVTLETAKLNDIKIDVVRTDLFAGLENLIGKVQTTKATKTTFFSQVDVLLFNPPYVPTEEEPSSNIELTYAGGRTGRSTLDRLLPRVPELLSPRGVFYLVALHSNDIPSLLKEHSDRMTASVSMERRCGIEHLYILKFVMKEVKEMAPLAESE
uniref:Methyltransferase HEMK2 n=1 Tax=Caenorhabditis tropicalis TaxID=1561998 RepID=A0A1I7T5Z6_9PELO